MNVLLYGTGAVGLGVGSCLLAAGESVSFLTRETTVRSLRGGGLMRTGIFGDHISPPDSFRAASRLEDLQVDAPFDHILICTKSFDSASAAVALSAVAEVVSKTTPLVLFQNGWGNAEVFAKIFPTERIFNARVITGFRRPQPNHVDITVHADSIHIGNLWMHPLEPIVALCRSIHIGGIPTLASASIGKDLWSKMLFNCSLNPLGALLDVPYGALGEGRHSREIMNSLIREVFAVMHAAGYSTHWPTPETFMETFYKAMVPATARHESSMLQDIRAHRPTEIDALNGAVIRLGVKHGIDTPTHRTIYSLIRFREGIAQKQADAAVFLPLEVG